MTPWQALAPAQRDEIVIKAMTAPHAAQAAKLAELRRAMAARKKANNAGHAGKRKGKRR